MVDCGHVKYIARSRDSLLCASRRFHSSSPYSLDASVRTWSEGPYTLVLSHSSPTDDISDQTREWELVELAALSWSTIPRIGDKLRRRSNVAFSKSEVARADYVMVTNDDVVIDLDCAFNLLGALNENMDATIAVGCVRPDPSFSKGNRRAGAFQLNVVASIANELPLAAARAEGAIWATRGSFASSYRYPVGEGSIVDDVELISYIRTQRLLALNIPRAIVYKVPPSSFLDFANQTRRSSSVAEPSGAAAVWLAINFHVFALELMRDPLGASRYVAYRIFLIFGFGKVGSATTQQWDRSSGITFR